MAFVLGQKFTAEELTQELVDFCNDNNYCLNDINETRLAKDGSETTLVYELAKVPEPTGEEQRAYIRQLRVSKCFSYINRGQLWYDMLTDEQKEELRTWYIAWLDAPATLIIPEPPKWLNDLTKSLSYSADINNDII